MKKLILPLLMILMTAVVFAQIEPTITNITELDFTYSEGRCDWVNDIGYCYWGRVNGSRDDLTYLRLFNLTDYSFDTLKTIEWNSTPIIIRWDLLSEGDYLYLVDENEFLIYDTITDTFSESVPVDTGITLIAGMSCDILIGTDTIICFAEDSQSPYYATIFEIDKTTGENSILVKNYEMLPIPYSSRYTQCLARNSDEIYCTWGNYHNKTMRYTYSTNTTELFTFGDYEFWAEQQCKWVDDILYCYATDIYDPARDYILTDEIFWFDPTTTDYGILNTTLPLPIATYSHVNNLVNEDYLIGGWYGTDWDYEGKSVLKIEWEIPPEPPEEGGLEPYEPAHGISDVTGLVIDFGVEFGLQAIALAGLIALVGLVVWIRPKLK